MVARIYSSVGNASSELASSHQAPQLSVDLEPPRNHPGQRLIDAQFAINVLGGDKDDSASCFFHISDVEI